MVISYYMDRPRGRILRISRSRRREFLEFLEVLLLENSGRFCFNTTDGCTD